MDGILSRETKTSAVPFGGELDRIINVGLFLLVFRQSYLSQSGLLIFLHLYILIAFRLPHCVRKPEEEKGKEENEEEIKLYKMVMKGKS